MKLRTVPSQIMAMITVFALAIAVHATPPNDAGTAPEAPHDREQVKGLLLPTLDEAKGRAKLLHESMHATLQVVHHEYFREEKGIPIPAATLKRVFRELAIRQHVELRWLAVNAQAMNVDHNPHSDFERQAVRALTSGKEDFESVEDGVFRYVGAITLTSDCLKCHLPNRTSTKDRIAGLVISMRIKP